jgi:hypothetical protein
MFPRALEGRSSLDLLIAGGDDAGFAGKPNRGESTCVFYHALPCNRFEST